MKFCLDTFYLDGNSAGTIASYAFQDRKILAESGVLVFSLEENPVLRTISNHIFVDSRGFVQNYELAAVHKEIVKVIRTIYEKSLAENIALDRGSLVKNFKQEISKFCFAKYGRSPLVIPIITEKK